MRNKGLLAGGALAGMFALAAGLVAHWEGYEPNPYRDVIGTLTVCYGHTGDVQDRTYSRAECNDLLHSDLAKADAAVRRCMPEIPAPQIEAALVSAAYNLGPQVVCGSTIQRRARNGDWRGVCDGLLAWHFAGGQPLQGLKNRRAAERALCVEGVP